MSDDPQFGASGSHDAAGGIPPDPDAAHAKLIQSLAAALSALQKPTEDSKSNWFSTVKLEKEDNFPKLYSIKGDIPSRLDADEAVTWKTDINNWLAAHGMHGVFSLTELIVKLSPDGAKRLPLDEAHPEWENPRASTESMRNLLMILSDTAFGIALKMPSTAKIAALEEDRIRGAFADFVNVSNLLMFRLSQSARTPSTNLTVMPEIFAGFNDVLMIKPGEMHPLVGFLAIAVIDNTFARNPLGTVFQMKDKLIAYIRGIPSDSTFTIHKILPLLNEVNLKMANISMKDPECVTQLHKEVINVLMEVLRIICSNTYIRDAAKSSSELTNAAELAASHLMKWSQDKTLTWHEFQMQMTQTLGNNLPPAPPTTGDGKKQSEKAQQHPLALASIHTQQGRANGEAVPR